MLAENSTVFDRKRPAPLDAGAARAAGAAGAAGGGAMADPASDPAGVLAYNNEETLGYLESHGVGTLFKMLLKDVIESKPTDPIS